MKCLSAVAMVLSFSCMTASAATFVYVSNAEDGEIATYRMADTGELQPGPRAKAASVVMPMAVSPDRRFLYAGVRSKPYSVIAYSIDSGTGEKLGMLASATVGEGGWVDLSEPIIVRAGEAFIAVPEQESTAKQ